MQGSNGDAAMADRLMGEGRGRKERVRQMEKAGEKKFRRGRSVGSWKTEILKSLLRLEMTTF